MNLSIYLSKTTLERAKEAASNDSRSVSSFVALALKNQLKQIESDRLQSTKGK